jgi:predicted aspartyl protease
MIFTHQYDTNYDPAMPVTAVNVRRMGQDNGTVLVALVDSGSDATMIPISTLKKIGARRAEKRRVRGIAGFSYIVDTYFVSLQVGTFHASYVIAITDQQNGQMILGRDVLNEFIVTLNGLANLVEISD